MKIIWLFSLLIMFATARGVLARTSPERIRISSSSGGMTSIDLFI